MHTSLPTNYGDIQSFWLADKNMSNIEFLKFFSNEKMKFNFIVLFSNQLFKASTKILSLGKSLLHFIAWLFVPLHFKRNKKIQNTGLCSHLRVWYFGFPHIFSRSTWVHFLSNIGEGQISIYLNFARNLPMTVQKFC